MKKAAVLLLLTVLSTGLFAQDDSALSTLGQKLKEYTAAIDGESIAVKNSECDFLISTCQLPETRQYAALWLYEHYRGSKVLGDEDVAVHIASQWFLTEKVPMKTEADFLSAKLFVHLNEKLLLGMKTPASVLKDENLLDQAIPSEGRYSVLYFYDTSCSSCRIESSRLDAFVRTSDLPVDFYAIYTGSDEAAWALYRATSLRGGFIHLFDPSGDVLTAYGIISTPRMFLIAPDGTILGRGLDTPSLKALLEKELEAGAYEYGSDASTQLFDSLLKDASASDVYFMIETIRTQTLERGDTLGWKRLTGDLLYYLAPRRGEGLKEGEQRLVDIILAEDFRSSPEDSASVLPLARLRHDLLALAPVGSKVPDLTVNGTLLRRGKAPRQGTWRLRRLRNSRITFYTEGCATCRETIAEADSIASSTRGLKVLTVSTDALPDSQLRPALSSLDLSALPYTFTVCKGRISHRYL